MADIGVKMGVTGISQFRQGMNQAQQSVKTLDAALKLNEKQFQATGDKEEYLAQKTKLLQNQIKAQNSIIKQGQAALAAMEKNGVNPASAAYQKMQQQVLNAQTALLGMHGDLDSVGTSAQETAKKTDKLSDSLNSINKKVSFDAVLNGIGRITDGMEAAAKKVASLATDVWNTMAASAAWADNENTLAAMYGIDVETLQRMQGASRTIDTTVEAIIKARQKLGNALTYGSKDIEEAFAALGLAAYGGKYEDSFVIQHFDSIEDAFWAVGGALKAYGDEIERDAMAQKIFGKSWQELRPLFNAGREEYEKTLAEQTIVTEENVNKLNALDDSLQKLTQDYEATKNTLLSELAPAFTQVADTLSGLIREFNAYLQTEEGQQKLSELGEAVTGLFSGLSDVDFSSALGTATGILDSITGALGWIKDNKDGVILAIQGIGGAFLTLKAAEVIGTLAQGAIALKGLLGGGAAAAGSAAASTATSAAASGVEIALGGGLLTKLAGGISSFVTSAGGILTNLALTIPPVIDTVTKPGYLENVTRPLSNPVETFGKWFDLSEGAKQKGLQAAEDAITDLILNPQGFDFEKSNQNLDALQNALTGGLEKNGIREETVKDIYDQLYQAINDYDPETDANATLFFDSVLGPMVDEASKQGGIVGEQAQEIADLFRDKWFESLNDEEWEGTTGGLLAILQDAIDDAAANKLTVEATPTLPADAGDILQQMLSGVTLHVPVVPRVVSGDGGSFANGLPFVPFDGYVAAMHKGARIVPANQNRSYTTNSNLYVENMHMNNGTDAPGLASAIAERTRRTMASFGS